MTQLYHSLQTCCPEFGVTRLRLTVFVHMQKAHNHARLQPCLEFIL